MKKKIIKKVVKKPVHYQEVKNPPVANVAPVPTVTTPKVEPPVMFKALLPIVMLDDAFNVKFFK